MTDQPQSGAERHIEMIMQQLDPSSDRYRVLDVARRFKSSWVELGEELLQVSRNNLYRQWGYDSFQDYCAREIHIKQPTAQKLTRAFQYLAKEEPELLSRRKELKPLPDYRTIDLLRQAREEEDFSGEQYAELRRAVLEEERSHPAVRRQFKEMSRANANDPAAEYLQACRSALSAARRLAGCLESLEDLAGPCRESIAELISRLEDRVQATSLDDSEVG
ncbi:MAG: hypothetical protein R2940_03035 [Syntrophotaleaceae bacterium]